VPRLFEELALARSDGRHPRLLRNLGRADLLILTIGGWSRSTPRPARPPGNLEERYGRRSTMITSQLPVDRWHEIIGDPTYADAILDRLVHNAHRIELEGESMRRRTRAKQSEKIDQPPLPVDTNPSPARLATRAASFRYGGRHHPGIPGGFIPFYPGDFIGIRKARSELHRYRSSAFR